MQIKLYDSPARPTEGRFAIVTNAGRDAVDAGGAKDEGVSCGRRSRVVLTPRRWCQVRAKERGRRWQKKPGRRGERDISRKTIARGMPGDSGVTVVTMLACFLHYTRGCGRIERPVFPAPSDWRVRKFPANLGPIQPRGREVVYGRHCEEHLRRTTPFFFVVRWLASLALAMTIVLAV